MTAKPALRNAAILLVFIGTAIILRGRFIGNTEWINPDEAEMIAQARAAMRSPVPFTTWTTATTGPIWVYFLAFLGALGLPMTIAFGHFLAAVLVGLLGYFGYELARPALGNVVAVALTLLWWLPIVVTLIGDIEDFAALNTELLPCALVLGAALIRSDALAKKPWLYLVSGLTCSLALFAKYQIVPVVFALLLVQLIGDGVFQWRILLRRTALWGAGALVPVALIGLAMALAPSINVATIDQTLAFLTAYSGEMPFGERLASTLKMVRANHVVLMTLIVVWLAVLSIARIRILRLMVVLAGLLAVLLGGRAVGHYLIITFTALAIAMGLPLKPEARLIPFVRRPAMASAIAAFAVLLLWLNAFGLSPGRAQRLTRTDLSKAFSYSSAGRDPRLAEACPAGSNVVIWGWASEYYIAYSWNNAIPVLNTTLFTAAPVNYASGQDLMRTALQDRSTDCVVDAVGPPFFAIQPSSSLTLFYPGLRDVLATEYRPAGTVIDCEACTVYVRRRAA